MRKAAIYVIAIAIPFIAIDIICSYFLFYFFQVKGYEKPDFTYAADGHLPTAVVLSKAYAEMTRRIGAPAAKATTATQCTPHADPSPLYHYMKDYGYGYLPGRYDITFCPTPRSSTKSYKWTMTIEDDLGRRTAGTTISRDKKVIIFGGSLIFGWGLNDQQTMGWLLQDYFRDTRVVKNYSHSGGGTIHSLIKFRLIKDQLTSDDVILIGYGPYALERNPAAPSRIATEAGYIEQKWGKGTDLMHPRGRLVDGRVVIDYIPLRCDTPERYCEGPNPTLQEMSDLTVAAIDEIKDNTKAKVAIMYEHGDDGDAVIGKLRAQGVPIIDMRLDKAELFVADDISGYDTHPGPMGHYYWHTLVESFIDRTAAAAPNVR